VREAITCPSCGAKVRAGRSRCPRCRAVLAAPDPARAAAISHRLRTIAGGIFVAFVVVTAVLWTQREPAPPEAPQLRQPPDDPLARRRPQAGPEPAARKAVESRAFMEPSGVASAAYTAGDYVSALEQFQAAVDRNPRDAESLSNLGQVLVRLNRAAEAVPYFERAIAEIPNRWAYHFNLARALGQTGKWEPAVAAYRRAQALFPDDYATAFNLGQALHRMGDETAAVEAYQKAIALEPNDASFRMALGISYERLDRRAEAAAAYGEALRLNPAAPDADTVKERIARLTVAPAAPAPAAAAPVPPGPGPGGD
jgi:tetratricopeptide (TPR) repeat protein